MLATLNLVKGAVAKKDLVPVLTHFHIYDGRIQGGNGRIAIDAICPEMKGRNFTVPALKFIAAIDGCTTEPKIDIIDDGKIKVSAGKFKATLPLANHDEYTKVEPEGEVVIFPNIILSLKRLEPFISEDASRLWACGILVKDGYAYATNNIIVARIPFPWHGRSINIPAYALDEIFRVGMEPNEIRISENNISFIFGNGMWIRAQLASTEWPNAGMIIERSFEAVSDWQEIPDGLRDGIDRILPFCPNKKFPVIHLGENGIATEEGETAAHEDVAAFPPSKFHADPLSIIAKTGTKFDLSLYPNPCPFTGLGDLEGVIIGVNR